MGSPVDLLLALAISTMMEHRFTPSRAAALERLSAFLPHAGRSYAARRNYDLGAGHHVHVSALSPYLRCRLLTEEEVITAVLEQHGPIAAEKFVQEVFWRTYWKGWLELRPSVWDSYQATLMRDWNGVQSQSGLRQQWEAACRGNTNIECFNKWAQELVTTGYLHNHARMWFASIWIFTLKLPWALGADFFLRHLLDGDPASNTLGWRWVAGIQTRGKTYLARSENISKYTEARFDPAGQLALEAVPLDAPDPPAPRLLPEQEKIDPNLRTGFLLHEDDLSPGFALRSIAPVACARLNPQNNIGPLVMSSVVPEFREAAMNDTYDRWSTRLGPATNVCDTKSIAAWVRATGIDQIVTAYAPTGTVSKLLTTVSKELPGIRVCSVQRYYDKKTWPHATRGFFAFKKKIPDFVFNFEENIAP